LIRSILKEKLFYSALVVAVMLPATFYYKGIDPFTRISTERARFFVLKVNFKPDANVLFVGHSRVMRDLSPGHFSTVMPGLKVRNYAFPSLQYDRDTLADIDALMSDGPGRKIIIMEFSPWVIPTRPLITNRNKIVQEARGHTALVKWLLLEHPDLYALLQPPGMYQLWRRLVDGSGYAAEREEWALSERHTRYHDNGWAERIGWQTFSPVLHEPRAKLKTAPGAIELIYDQIRRWRERGIQVIGIQTPIGPERQQHENARFEVSMKELREGFTAAGGRFLNIQHGRYSTYDGSHLASREAIRYTKDLARRIKNLSRGR
jgi:hypothetical protein